MPHSTQQHKYLARDQNYCKLTDNCTNIKKVYTFTMLPIVIVEKKTDSYRNVIEKGI